jgi:hypothetical protein
MATPADPPDQPKPCKLILASPGWLTRLQYPGEPVTGFSDTEYVVIQLGLYSEALKNKEDSAWKWADGALAMFLAMEPKQRRELRRDAEVRRAAYSLIKRPAPQGLSKAGRTGYCNMFRTVRRLLPPLTKDERRALRRALKKLRC